MGNTARILIPALPMLALLATPVSADELSGHWTFGFSLGEARTAEFGGTAADHEYEFLDRNRRYAFDIGYQFHDNFDVTASYIDGGWHDGTVIEPDGSSRDMSAPLSQYAITFGGRWPVSSAVRGYARLGLTEWHMKAASGGSGLPSVSDRSPMGELGVEWQPDRSGFVLQIAYSRVDDGISSTTVGMTFPLRVSDDPWGGLGGW
jgi:hypothetical protein